MIRFETVDLGQFSKLRLLRLIDKSTVVVRRHDVLFDLHRVINFEVVFYEIILMIRNAFDVLKIILDFLLICVLLIVVTARRLYLMVLKEDLRLRQVQFLIIREAL